MRKGSKPGEGRGFARGVRIRRATVGDLDLLVEQRRKLFEVIRHRTLEEHRLPRARRDVHRGVRGHGGR